MLVSCAVCGAQTNTALTALPDPAEPPDFDTRPGQPLRSTLPLWITQCRNCGYAAEDVTRAVEAAPSVVRSPEFQSLREDSTVPDPGRAFLCFAHLLDKLKQRADAGWSCLHAAWACDDAGNAEAAAVCRNRAIALWRQGKEGGESFGDNMASEFALITDVHRRLGQFEHATIACSEGLEIEDLPAALEAVFRRQLVLIQTRDTAAHSLRELMPPR